MGNIENEDGTMMVCKRRGWARVGNHRKRGRRNHWSPTFSFILHVLKFNQFINNKFVIHATKENMSDCSHVNSCPIHPGFAIRFIFYAPFLRERIKGLKLQSFGKLNFTYLTVSRLPRLHTHTHTYTRERRERERGLQGPIGAYFGYIGRRSKRRSRRDLFMVIILYGPPF